MARAELNTKGDWRAATQQLAEKQPTLKHTDKVRQISIKYFEMVRYNPEELFRTYRLRSGFSDEIYRVAMRQRTDDVFSRLHMIEAAERILKFLDRGKTIQLPTNND